MVGPRRREGDVYADIDWARVPGELTAKLSATGPLAAVLSPHLTVEEAYLLAKFMRSIDPEAVLAMGPVPVVGEDERFKSGFTIRAEKCPNRLGVEAILWHFTGGCLTFDDFLEELRKRGFRGVWVSGGYKTDWNDQATAERFAGVELLIVQDMFASPLWKQATYQLPGASFAEREGSYVNVGHRLQSVRWAVRPPAGAWVEGALYWRLLNMPGMYNARRVLDEIATEISSFAVAADAIPAVGVDLRINQLAEQTVGSG
jgi:NADH-quinone oxidoreductase subunit G